VPPAQDPPPGDDQEKATEAFKPQVLILSSGELTAFALDLSAPGYDVGYRVAGTLIGRISLERVERDGLL
jgi:general secretion pathway protein H